MFWFLTDGLDVQFLHSTFPPFAHSQLFPLPDTQTPQPTARHTPSTTLAAHGSRLSLLPQHLCCLENPATRLVGFLGPVGFSQNCCHWNAVPVWTVWSESVCCAAAAQGVQCRGFHSLLLVRRASESGSAAVTYAERMRTYWDGTRHQASFLFFSLKFERARVCGVTVKGTGGLITEDPIFLICHRQMSVL